MRWSPTLSQTYQVERFSTFSTANESAATHVKLQEMPKLRQLAVQIFVHRVKSLLQLLLGLRAHWVVRRVVVDVGKEDGLRERGLDVLPRAAIAVTTCANLEEERLCVGQVERNTRYALCSRTSSSPDLALYRRYLPSPGQRLVQTALENTQHTKCEAIVSEGVQTGGE